LKLRFALALVVVVPAMALVAVAIVGNRASHHHVNQAYDRKMGGDSVGHRVPVLVELFTSEGCSSCPPADELLMSLEQSQPVAGVEIIALSEHVDYWNRLGWTDPYSSAEFSTRQNDYARIFQTDEVYTPQMIVDGHSQFVGNNAAKASDVIGQSAHEAKANVTIAASVADQGSDSVTFDVKIDGFPQNWKGKSADVLLAITESGLRSNVAAGENRGRRLTHTAVVRKINRLGSVDSKKDQTFSVQPVVRVSKAWKRDNLKAVVFVQDHATRQVLGAAALPFAK